MVTKAKSAKPVRILAHDVKHKVGNQSFKYKKGELMPSDTPAKIVSHLERIGVLTTAEAVEQREAKDAE